MPGLTENQKPEKITHEILLVDDDPRILHMISKALENKGYLVTRARSGEAAIELLHTRDFALVITDINMGQTSGIAVLKKAKDLNPERKVIIMTGNIDVTLATESLRLEVDDYLLKPFDLSDLLERVSHCLNNSSSPGSNS